MQKIISVLIFFLILSPGFAADDSVKTASPAAAKNVLQGDFQVFKLGDSRRQVIEKIGNYINEGKTDFLAGQGNRIILKPDNLPVSFRYQKNKLYMISIIFEPGYKGINDRREIMKFLTDLLTKTYGQATTNNGYPPQTEIAQSYLCVNWTLTGKNVDIVVRTDYRNYQEVTIEIYDPQVRATVDEEQVKDFG